MLLFDEPLSALDRNLRDTLKYSILDLQRRTKKTAIYVTHDQSEAFAISDRIFVMNSGRIEQSGTQLDIYLRPTSEFVANFVGDNNALPGTVVQVLDQPDGDRQATVASGGMTLLAYAPAGLQAGDAVLAFVRPENIEVLDDAEGRNEIGVVEASVEQIVFEGPAVRLTVDANGTPLKINVGGLERLTLLDGSRRKLRLRLREISLVRAEPAA